MTKRKPKHPSESVWWHEVEDSITGRWRRIGQPFGDRITAERAIHVTPFQRVAEYRRITPKRPKQRRKP